MQTSWCLVFLVFGSHLNININHIQMYQLYQFPEVTYPNLTAQRLLSVLFWIISFDSHAAPRLKAHTVTNVTWVHQKLQGQSLRLKNTWVSCSFMFLIDWRFHFPLHATLSFNVCVSHHACMDSAAQLHPTQRPTEPSGWASCGCVLDRSRHSNRLYHCCAAEGRTLWRHNGDIMRKLSPSLVLIIFTSVAFKCSK